MKIDELISELEQVKEEHGNLEVVNHYLELNISPRVFNPDDHREKHLTL